MHEPENGPFDIIIVGAGMVGAALALGLGEQGWRVALIEQTAPLPVEHQSAPDLRVSAINAHSESLLRNLGVWAGIEASRVAPFSRLAVWESLSSPLFRSDRPVNEICFDAADLGQARFGHIIENNVTQWALWKLISAHPQIQCFCPDELDALHQHGDFVEVELAGGTTLKASLVVGADGAGSKVRTLANIGIYREQYDQQALVTTVVHQGLPQNITWQAFSPTGPRAYLPLPAIDGQTWASLVWYDSPTTIEALHQLSEPDFIHALQSAFPKRLPKLISAPARASFPLAKMQAQRYFHGRVTLIGDAAHTINPLAGQGVNLGFEDVDCLLALLDRSDKDTWPDPGNPVILKQYQDRRRPASQRMMGLMDLFYYTFSNRRLSLLLARNLGLIAGARLPLGKSLVARYAMGVAPLPDSLIPGNLIRSLPGPLWPDQWLGRLRPRKNPVRRSSS